MISPLSFIWANVSRRLKSDRIFGANLGVRLGKRLLSTSKSVTQKSFNKTSKNMPTASSTGGEGTDSLSALSFGLLFSVSPLFILFYPDFDIDNDMRTNCEQRKNEGKKKISFRQRRLTQAKIISTPPKHGNTGKQKELEAPSSKETAVPSPRILLATEIDENDAFSLKKKSNQFNIGNNMNVAAYSCHGLEPFTPSSIPSISLPNNVKNHGIQSDQDSLSSSLSNILDYLPNSMVPSAFARTPQLKQNNDNEISDIALGRTMISQLTCNKINQDRGNIVTLIPNHLYMMAVYDGHGTCGELLAQFVMEKMSSKMEKYYNSTIPEDNCAISINDSVLTKFCLEMDNELTPHMHPFSSGTTACILLYQPQKNELVAINVGDSRAVLGSLTTRKETPKVISKNHNNVDDGNSSNIMVIIAKALTTDQTPRCPNERQRILNSGGYVTVDSDTRYPARIWADEKCTQVGLAMSRSIGDFVLKSLGVIAKPVITRHSISPQDQFLILATDGLWEFISSQEATEIIYECKFNHKMNIHEACKYLINAAKQRWGEEEGDYRDDITAIVLDLQNK